MNIDIDKIAESILKSIIVGILGFGVNYLKGIGVELTELRYEIRALGENQRSVNKELMTKISSHESRLKKIEKKIDR